MSEAANLHFYFTAISSAIASVFSKFLIYPIETIKNKVQVNRKTRAYQPGLIKTLIFKTWNDQGIRGFYRGVILASIGSAPACCVYMTTYQISKQKLSNFQFFNEHSGLRYILSGFLAELVSCVLWLPLDVIKQRMQTQSELRLYNYKTSYDAFTTIKLKQGKIGLYRSYGGTLLYFGPFSALYFYIYETFKKKFNTPGEKPKFWKSAAMAGTSGILAGIFCNPIDLAKIRMQVDVKLPGSQIFAYRNVFHGIYVIFTQEGFLSLYKGCFMRIWTTGPITASIMGTTEFIRKNLKEYYQIS